MFKRPFAKEAQPIHSQSSHKRAAEAIMAALMGRTSESKFNWQDVPVHRNKGMRSEDVGTLCPIHPT